MVTATELINAYDVMTMLGAAAIPAGGLPSWIGRIGARSAMGGFGS
ncbi:MAG: hypothetical protein NXH88_12605 [Hyphomonas sp.]|nr:hypothetical protein [Hyphomonas sp.]